MNLTYNDFDIGALGEFTVSQSREIDDSQRAKVTLKIGVTLFNRTYDANYTAVMSLKEALRTQQGTLVWTNTDTHTDYVNRTVTLQSDDLPDEWGTYQMAFNLVFYFYEQDLITQNMPMVLTAAVGSPLNLGSVSKFKEDIASERFSPYHSHRSITKGSVSVSGYLLADAAIPLSDRRTALVTQAAALRTALTQAEGVLTFGGRSG